MGCLAKLQLRALLRQVVTRIPDSLYSQQPVATPLGCEFEYQTFPIGIPTRLLQILAPIALSFPMKRAFPDPDSDPHFVWDHTEHMRN